MVVFPNCKINLGLNIVSKRDDGFHNIETVFYPVGLHDALEIIPAPDGRFEMTMTGLPVPGDPETNLCFRAWKIMQAEFGLPPVRIHLHKVIPMGAGLGGGSSDAACTLSLLNRVFALGLDDDQLEQRARLLGSDCAFFIRNVPVAAHGRGDLFLPANPDLSGLTVVLAFPGIHVGTAEAYGSVTPSAPVNSPGEIADLPVGDWLGLLVNDFEGSVFQKYPEIARLKSEMYRKGAVYAAMSGSGSSVFGLFREVPDLSDAFRNTGTWVSPQPE